MNISGICYNVSNILIDTVKQIASETYRIHYQIGMEDLASQIYA